MGRECTVLESELGLKSLIWSLCDADGRVIPRIGVRGQYLRTNERNDTWTRREQHTVFTAIEANRYPFLSTMQATDICQGQRYLSGSPVGIKSLINNRQRLLHERRDRLLGLGEVVYLFCDGFAV
jgi:hypothetical protein